MVYLYLSIAIIAEVVATNALKASEGFTNWWPSVVVIVGYGLSFYLLSLVLKSVPVGVTYAIWAGMGIVLTALFATIFFNQILDLPAILGMGLIILGVVVIHVFSKTVTY